MRWTEIRDGATRADDGQTTLRRRRVGYAKEWWMLTCGHPPIKVDAMGVQEAQLKAEAILRSRGT